MMETKNKTALVTGAASGMGAAAARMFAQAGYSVMLADMNGTAVEAAVQGLAASGYEADYTVCDVTDEAQVKAMVEKTVARFGKLDAAYNNAGIMPARVETADTETEAFRPCDSRQPERGLALYEVRITANAQTRPRGPSSTPRR